MISMMLFREILKYFMMMLLGYLLVKMKILKASDSAVLSKLLIYVVVPCVIVKAFQIKMDQAMLQGLLLAFTAAGIIHLLLFLFVTLIGKPLRLSGIEKASVMYSNAGNMIIPIVIAIFGDEWVLYTSAYIAVQLLLLWSHGKALVCEEGKADWKTILLNINMIAIGVGIGLMAFQIYLPEVITECLDSVGTMMAPVSMVVIGMLITEMNLKKIILDRRIYLIAFLRLLVCPLLILIAFRVSGITGIMENAGKILFISFLATATPVCSTITQMTLAYDKDAAYASSINIATTLWCIITIPLMTEIYSLLLGKII
ncbi:AEC family transporter [Laedolimicola sp.]|uniref:AEC family transporter n=1 Tax=Laedolimicola sp. TaxID=2981663 RepID=UPI003F7EF546